MRRSAAAVCRANERASVLLLSAAAECAILRGGDVAEAGDALVDCCNSEDNVLDTLAAVRATGVDDEFASELLRAVAEALVDGCDSEDNVRETLADFRATTGGNKFTSEHLRAVTDALVDGCDSEDKALEKLATVRATAVDDEFASELLREATSADMRSFTVAIDAELGGSAVATRLITLDEELAAAGR